MARKKLRTKCQQFSEVKKLAEIVFDSSARRRTIHPAVDLIDGVLYFGLMLPVRTTHLSDHLCFVSSNRECWVATKDELERRSLKLRFPDIAMELRWELEDIHDYLQNGANVDARGLLMTLHNLLKQYLEFTDEEMYLVVALWIVGTYLLPIWRTYPYLSISGAKRVGKSKSLSFLEQTAFNPVFSANISTPTLYRLVQSLRCTMLIDESERLETTERASDMRNILNSGYKRGGKVFRSVKMKGDRIVPQKFETFSPKALVTYKGIEEITEDRCIAIVMVRSANSKIINSEISEDDRRWAACRNTLYRFALQYFQDVQREYEMLIAEDFVSRERELWKPILALASFFGVQDKIYSYALEQSKRKVAEDVMDSRETQLLKVLNRLVTEDRVYYIKEIRAAMIEELSREGEDIPRWLTNWWLGRTLSRTFNLRESVHTSDGRGRRISPLQIKNLCYRYGVITSQLEKTKTVNLLSMLEGGE